MRCRFALTPFAATSDENGARLARQDSGVAGPTKPVAIWCFEPACEDGRTRLVAQRSVAFRLRAAEHEKNVCVLLRVHCPAAKGASMQILYSRCCGIDVHVRLVPSKRMLIASGDEGVKEVSLSFL